MPAPAVIPAPKAYINAVAVKGFVVELGAFLFFEAHGLAPSTSDWWPVPLGACEHSETKNTGAVPS